MEDLATMLFKKLTCYAPNPFAKYFHTLPCHDGQKPYKIMFHMYQNVCGSDVSEPQSREIKNSEYL